MRSHGTMTTRFAIALCCGGFAAAAMAAEVSTRTVTTTVTKTTEVEEVRRETAVREPLRVCILDFESATTLGQERFLSGKNAAIKIPKAMTLVEADRTSVDSVMQGWVRVVDATSNLRTDDANRAAQTDDNRFDRAKALAVYQETVKGQARPIVIGADYLEGFLGKYAGTFSCVGRRTVKSAMAKIAAEPDFPQDCLSRLGKTCGITHLVTATVSDIRTKETAFSGYGLKTKTTTYQLDVILKVIDLKTQGTVFSDVFTGSYREQRPISGEQFDNNIFHSLMNGALEQAAEKLNETFGAVR